MINVARDTELRTCTRLGWASLKAKQAKGKKPVTLLNDNVRHLEPFRVQSDF